MCRAVRDYLTGLRQAWNAGVHDYDSPLTKFEEEREVLEPQSSRTANPPGGAGSVAVGFRIGFTMPGGGHPTCPYCGGSACCDRAGEDAEFYRWEHDIR